MLNANSRFAVAQHAFLARSRKFPGLIIEASLGRFHRTDTSLRLISPPRSRSKISVVNYSHSIVALGFGDIS